MYKDSNLQNQSHQEPEGGQQENKETKKSNNILFCFVLIYSQLLLSTNSCLSLRKNET